MQSKRLWTKDFLGTCFSSLFIFLTFYMLMTTLPVYVIDGLKGKPEEIGLVATVFLISSVLCRPFTGKWLDDLGRKKILFISLSLFLAATVMYFGVQSFFFIACPSLSTWNWIRDGNDSNRYDRNRCCTTASSW